MVEYLEANSLLTDKQHGFRANRSYLTQMLAILTTSTKGLLVVKIQILFIWITLKRLIKLT